MPDYIPMGGARLLVWAQHFAAKLVNGPADYGLGAADAAEISQAVEHYTQAYSRIRGTGSRSKSDYLTKDQARTALLATVRKYARIIKASPGVSRSALADLGLNRPADRSRISAPGSRPAVHIMSAQPLRHFLRFSNLGGPDEQEPVARPPGAIGLQLFCHVGDAAPADPLDARFLRFISKRSYIAEFKAEQRGLTAYYYARWQTATGETGPWSQVAAMTVAG